MSKPTLAVILGAGETAELYSSLLTNLEAKGFPTVCAEPPSITVEDASTVTTQDDVNFIRDSVLAPLIAEDKDIVVVAHSYGGGYGAAATQGLSKKERAARGDAGGIVGIIYIAALCMDPGESALEALRMDLSNPLPGIVPGEKPGTLTFTDYKLIWTTLPADQGEVNLKKLRPCAVSALLGPMPYAPYKDPAYHDAIAFVIAERDAILTTELNRMFLEKSSISLTRRIGAAHGIDSEARREVVKTLVELAEHFAAGG